MARIITVQQSRLIFSVLTANGAFSAGSGLIFVLLAQPLAAWTGLSQTHWLTGIGTMLILFGARLLWLGRRKSVHQWEALLISGLDLGWVIITVGLAVGIPELFTLAGVYAVCVVALIILIFLDLQLYALWKCRV